MKLRRIAALVLAVALLPLPRARASQAIGSEVHEFIKPLGPGVELHTGRLWSATYSDLRTERYLTYTPNPGVTPAVAFGSSLSSKQTVPAMAKGFEAYGRRVLAGVNGDYYVVATGVPLGMVLTNGVLRSSPGYHPAVGFLPDGSAIAGYPQLTMYISMLGTRYGVGALNKTRTVEYGIHLFTSEFGPNTQNSQPGIDIILIPIAEQPMQEEGSPGYDTQLRIGGRVECTVEAVLHSEREISIPEGAFVLSVNAKCDAALLAELETIQAGDTVTLGVDTADPRWSQVVSAIGAFQVLASGGVVAEGLDTVQNPRTAVGVKPDGSAIFYTIDGRQSGYSVGASMSQVAARLIELGCTDAVLLDGGGSTTLGTTELTEDAFSAKNRSSDGAPRAVSNALFLVSNLEATGTLGSLTLTPDNAVLLAGARLSLSAFAVDTAYYPMYPITGAQFETSGGTVDGQGMLTAPHTGDILTVTASWGAEVSGSGTYTVVTTPDRIALTAGGEAVTAINLDPGEKIDLNAEAVYRNLPLVAQDGCFTWTVSPEVGTVDVNGVFTAGSRGGSGSLTVSAGERSFSIPVSVAGHVIPMETFEYGMGNIAGLGTMTATLETRPTYVRFGRQSLRLDYNAADGAAIVAASYQLPDGEEYLSLWVYGDGSGNAFAAMFLDALGGRLDAEGIALDFAGWKHVMIPIPEGAVALDRFAVGQAGTGDGLGTIWIDHMMTANQYVLDLDPPAVIARLAGRTLTARISDAVDKTMDKGQITLQFDGWLLDFNWSPDTGTLTAELPAVELDMLHRVTVTAADRSGNLGRASVDLPPEPLPEGVPAPTPPFADTVGHWAQGYTEYLYVQGVSLGYLDGQTRLFRPDAEITRGEFFVMVSRFLRLNTAQYDDVVLPFADLTAIPGWALADMRAMFALGYVQGSSEAGGVYAFAGNTLTRAEAMTILGRIQARGYPAAELDFLDASLVPSWAVDSMQTLVAQGIVTGYDGLLRPTDSVRRGEVAKLLYTIR